MTTVVGRAIRIARAGSAADLATVLALFDAYAAQLGIDLCFQGFAAERATLPGAYAPPGGALLLARDDDGTLLGCVAMRAIAGFDGCEMKRLYVTAEARGSGVGRALVERLVAEAITAGYRAMRLDTLPSMTAAVALYRDLGFVEIASYYATPVAGTLFFERPLAGG